MTTTITTDRIPAEAGGRSKTFLANGVFYVCLMPPGSDFAAQNIGIHKSTSDPDGGSFWSVQDSTGAPKVVNADGRINDVAATFDGTIIHAVTSEVWDSGTRHDVRYHQFDTSTDTWTLTDELIVGGDTDLPRPFSMVVRSDGSLVLLHSSKYKKSGTDHNDVMVRERSTGGAWSTASTITQRDGSDYDYGLVELGSSDRAHLFWGSPLGRAVYHRSLTSAGSLGTTQTVADDPYRFPADTASTGTEIIVLFSEYGTNSHYSVRFTSADTPTFGPITQVTATYVGGNRGSGVAYDATEGIYHATYRSDADTISYATWDGVATSWSEHGVLYTEANAGSDHPNPAVESLAGMSRLAVVFKIGGSGGDALYVEVTLGSKLFRWDGSAWVAEEMATWDGATWAVLPLYRWDGSAWVAVT